MHATRDEVWSEDARARWARIQAWCPDDPASAFPFTERLARDNGWTQAYAREVVEEYRRFAFLAVTAGHPVTPSDQVDQAWHLHLLYTRDYWGSFCPDVLGTPLHHGPTRGGTQERGKFHDWYARTQASYEAYFGHPPPAAVWPSSHVRFGADVDQRRVSMARHWVVSKSRVRRAGAVAVAALLVGGCAPTLVHRGDLTGVVVFGVVFLLLWFVVAPLARARRLERRARLLSRLKTAKGAEKRRIQAELRKLSPRRRGGGSGGTGWGGCAGGCGGCGGGCGGGGCGGCGGCG